MTTEGDILEAIQSVMETVSIDGGVWQDYTPDNPGRPYCVWTTLSSGKTENSDTDDVTEISIEVNVWGLLEEQKGLPSAELERPTLRVKCDALRDALHAKTSDYLPAELALVAINSDPPRTITVDRLHGQVKQEHRILVEG